MFLPEQPPLAGPLRSIVDELAPHEPCVRRYLARRFPSLETDDVVQEIYLKLLRTSRCEPVSSAKGFFFCVARNTARSLVRRGRLESRLLEDCAGEVEAADGCPDASEVVNRRQRLDLAAVAIERLPGRCREIVTLAAVHRLAPREIAARLGLAESTVHVQMARGVRKCADFVREKGD